MNISLLSFPFFPVDYLNAVGLTLTLYLLIRNYSRDQHNVKIEKFAQWFGKNSMNIFFVHCMEYHTTIPMIRSIYSQMDLFGKSLMYIANPILQVLICILLVYLYKTAKDHILTFAK